MCLIAYRSLNTNGKGSNLPNRVIEYNRRQNPDGFGIAWREDGKLLHQRFGPKDFGAFEDLLKSIDKDQTVEYVAHWRRATHGPICEDMSHPFSYDDKKAGQVLVFHNGIISNNPPKSESDTSYFVKSVLSQMGARWWSNPAYRYLVEQSTGWSRFLIMTETDIVRLNDNAWSIQNGIWYSTTPHPSMGGASASSKSTYSSHGGWADDDDYAYYGIGSNGARASWQAFEDDEEEDEEEEYAEVSSTDSSERTGFPHQGHWVKVLTTEDDLAGDDVYGAATCASCATLGEYYIIDGKVFIDVAHDWTDNPLVDASAETKNRALVPYANNALALGE